MLVLYRRQTSAAAADSMIVCDAGCRWHHMRHRLRRIAVPAAPCSKGCNRTASTLLLLEDHLALS
jgi:hypothetical protein